MSTGAAGSTATVTITGTAPNYVLNFTIPKGDKGDKGDKGADGTVSKTVKTLTSASSVTLATDEYQYLYGNMNMTLSLPDITTIIFNTPQLNLTDYQLGATTSGDRINGYLYSFRFYKKALNEYEVRCNCLYEATQGRTSVASGSEQSYFLGKWN